MILTYIVCGLLLIGRMNKEPPFSAGVSVEKRGIAAICFIAAALSHYGISGVSFSSFFSLPSFLQKTAVSEVLPLSAYRNPIFRGADIP